jgi:biopolymer transport protein ExbD
VSDSVTEASEPAKVLEVNITAQNTILIDGKTIASTDLQQVLKEQSASHPDGLSLTINPEARYELSVQVMDTAQAVGIEKLAINEG